MSVIAISTNKGGVLKTSLTVNLAGVLARQGKRVLIVDTDNQGNCALSFGLNPDQLKTTIYDVLISGTPFLPDAIRIVHDNIDLIGANDDMCFFEFDVLGNPRAFKQPFQLMRARLGPVRKKYDFVLIDTPPTLGLTQANVLTFADRVIVPFQPERYSMRSLIKIVDGIRDFREKHNSALDILAVVPTLIDSRTVLHSEVLQECRRFCQVQNILVTDTVIPRTVRFAASVAYDQKPLTISDPKSAAAKIYEQLLKELIG